jgi:opacity protein-like surface antigen
MMKKQLLIALALAGCAVAAPALGADAAPQGTASVSGFYGGVALRDSGADAAGINVAHLASTWGRFASPVTDDAARRTLVFGGYRWTNDVAVEGSFSTADRYSLRPFDAAAPRGIGLSLAGAPDPMARTWNADVYTSWSFLRRFALYGRLGYAQSDAAPSYALAAMTPTDPRRLRDGMNYGVGLRYDVTRALGLRLEYARFSRFAGETVTGPLPESDQVQFGMQFRF